MREEDKKWLVHIQFCDALKISSLTMGRIIVSKYSWTRFGKMRSILTPISIRVPTIIAPAVYVYTS